MPGLREPRLVVLTGGPGAGKTAVLEVVRRTFCEHVAVLPEAASILYGGGFPRRNEPTARRAAQRAIFRVQRELEQMALEERLADVVLCDRGTLDGLAYWEGSAADFETATGTTRAEELARYAAVIHLRTPAAGHGYNNDNPLRTESAEEAARLDRRILEVWSAHPRRTVIDAELDFMAKLARAVAVIRGEVACCASSPPMADAGNRGRPCASTRS